MTDRVKSVMGAVSAGPGRLVRTVIDFVFPPQCPLCGASRDDGGSFSPRFCPACAVAVAPPVADFCGRCGAPVGPHLDTSDGCIHCRDDAFAFRGVVCLGTYDGPLRRACLKAKESAGGPLAAALGELLWDRAGAALIAARADLITPVPLHWIHRLRRGHNPAATLAESLARKLNVPCAAPILAKRRLTPAQATLPATQRRLNLRDAFRARPNRAVSGKTVLLVDDVLTTGTTAHRCARALRQAGAMRVVVAVAARGIGQSAGAAQKPGGVGPALSRT